MTETPAYYSPRSRADVPVFDLDHAYEAKDPREYYNMLVALDYQTPGHIQALARQCLEYRFGPDEQPWVIDIGCGYGANGAGLLYNVTIQSLLQRYTDRKMDALIADDVIERDTLHFARATRSRYRVAGLDISCNALNYGLSTGLLNVAFHDDLTGTPAPDQLVDILATGPLIVESGVPIYVLPGIFDALLHASGAGIRPWVLTAPPRYANIAEYKNVLTRHRYVVERVSGTPLPHRRFHSREERQRVVEQQAKMGGDTSLEESTGYIHIDLYLARPADDMEFTPAVQA